MILLLHGFKDFYAKPQNYIAKGNKKKNVQSSGVIPTAVTWWNEKFDNP